MERAFVLILVVVGLAAAAAVLVLSRSAEGFVGAEEGGGRSDHATDAGATDAASKPEPRQSVVPHHKASPSTCDYRHRSDGFTQDEEDMIAHGHVYMPSSDWLTNHRRDPPCVPEIERPVRPIYTTGSNVDALDFDVLKSGNKSWHELHEM